MQMIDYNTRLFKNIFKSYNDFKTWYRQTGLSDDENDVPSQKTFTIIANEYNDSHVAMSPESFKERFANDLYSYYQEFEQTTKAISDLMKLTDKDIEFDNSIIMNIANIPEDGYTTSSEEVDFVTAQQKQISKKGKLQVSKELISNKRSFTVKTFLNRFRHLFIKVLTPAYTYVVVEDEED